jgi:hypothetical protein
MRDELFGDDHDFSKYDLLIELVEKTPNLKYLASIVMLTPNRKPNEGGRTNYEQGARRGKLHRFLQDCVNQNNGRQRSVIELRNIFDSYCDYRPYRDSQGEFLVDASREEYFKSVPVEILQSSLVFFDPDTGLETPRPKDMENREEYLLFSDLKEVFQHANEVTVFSVYQHYHHIATESQKRKILKERSSKLINEMELRCLFAVSSGLTTMFVFSKSSSQNQHLFRLLTPYAAMNGLGCELLFD